MEITNPVLHNIELDTELKRIQIQWEPDLTARLPPDQPSL